MRGADRAGAGRRRQAAARLRARLAAERLEIRDLPSIAYLLYAAQTQQGQQLSAPVSAAAVQGAPTPHEQAREAFVAKFSGNFATGPGRFTNQSMQTYIYGGGTSNAFLHGNFELAAFSPADPTTGQVTGTATLFVKNVANSGNELSLDLVGVPPANGNSPPTLMSWTVNGSSGGTFAGATGQGTVEIHYAPGGRLPPRATRAGKAFLIFRGQVQTTGTNNNLNPHF